MGFCDDIYQFSSNLKFHCSPEGALLGNSVITSHKDELISKYKAIDGFEYLLELNPDKIDLIYECDKLGYAITSMMNFLKCGRRTGYYTLLTCPNDGFLKKVELTHHCSLRNCPICAHNRKIKHRRKFKFLKQYPLNRQTYTLKFLTISPLNYSSLIDGFHNIKEGLSRLKRNKYFRDRVKGGIPIFEYKFNKELNNYNIHIHMIIYSRFLDNNIRGFCCQCGQNLIKKDSISNKYYCANRDCNSLNVNVKDKDSTLVKECNYAFRRESNVQITRINFHNHLLNYLLSYIGADKDNFAGLVSKEAEFMVMMRKKRLISPFGIFYKIKYDNPSIICEYCGAVCYWEFDFEVNKLIRDYKPPPKDLYDYGLEIPF